MVSSSASTRATCPTEPGSRFSTIRRLALAGALAVLASGAASAAATTVLRTAAQLHSEPKFVEQRDGVTGLCVDILRALENVDGGLRFSGTDDWMPLARIEKLLEVGALDVSCGQQITPSRQAHFTIPPVVLFTVNWQLAVRANDTVRVNDWDDVRRLGDEGIVLVNFGFGAATRLAAMPGLKVDSSGRESGENLLKLLAGRGRFFYYRSPGFKDELRPFKGRVKVLPAVMDSTPYYLLVGRHVSAPVSERIAAGLHTLERSGELRRLFLRWGDDGLAPSK